MIQRGNAAPYSRGGRSGSFADKLHQLQISWDGRSDEKHASQKRAQLPRRDEVETSNAAGRTRAPDEWSIDVEATARSVFRFQYCSSLANGYDTALCRQYIVCAEDARVQSAETLM